METNVTYKNFKSDYPFVYKMVLHMLDGYGINTDEYYYKYLNDEYDLSEAVFAVFGVIGYELTLELICNWILSTILTEDYIHVLHYKKRTKENMNQISMIIRDTFFVHELEFLSLVVNVHWKKDLDALGYLTTESYKLYENTSIAIQ